MREVVHVLLLLLQVHLKKGEDSTTLQYISVPSNLTVQRGQDASMDCNVLNLGGLPILWRKGYEVISAGDSLISLDRRLSLTTGKNRNSLNIKEVELGDEGEYSCQITTQRGVKTLTHSLTVLVPPVITTVPSNGLISVKERDYAKLECRALGTPSPRLTWYRKDGSMTHAQFPCTNKTCATFVSVTRGDTGDYFCQAENGVGDPVAAKFTLQVLYEPEARGVEETAQGGSGQALTLACKVRGEPKPSVLWYKDTVLIQDIGLKHFTFKIEETGPAVDTHILTILRADVHRFGNYTCEATNSVGSSRYQFEVHGRPSSPVFLGSTLGPESLSQMLGWRTTSFFPVLDYRILYKQIPQQKWTSVTISADSQVFQRIQGVYEVSWSLTGIEYNQEYDCIIQARNLYGWGNPSTIFTFKTDSDGGGSGLHLYSSSGYSVGLSYFSCHFLLIGLFCLFTFL